MGKYYEDFAFRRSALWKAGRSCSLFSRYLESSLSNDPGCTLRGMHQHADHGARYTRPSSDVIEPMRNVVLEVELGRVKRVVIDVGSIGDPVRNSGNSLPMRDDMDVTKMRKAYAATLVCLWMRGVGS